MLSVVTTETNQEVGHKETFKGDGYIFYLVCSDGNTYVYICPNYPSYIHYVQISVFTNYSSRKL